LSQQVASASMIGEDDANKPVSGQDDRIVRATVLPGGDLVAAVLNREVMSLADRGGASNLVGDRWADLCAEHALAWHGTTVPVPDADATPLTVERVVRLDATPQIAAAASRRGLQNPDLLLVGERDGAPTIQAADAKFSVETARSKQVSPAVVEALLGLRDVLPDLAGGPLPESIAMAPGVFLCPDYPLTHLMLRRRVGILRTTVRPEEVVMVPAPADIFFSELEGAAVMPVLAGVDRLPVRLNESLLAGLYYFRLSRAAVGCWLDATKPLLLYHDHLAVDEASVAAETASRTTTASSAYGLVEQWHADVQVVRADRAAVEQVAGLPLVSRDLRELIARLTPELAGEPPSVNQVRRRLGSWYRMRLREQVGPLRPPVDQLPQKLQEIARIGASLNGELQAEARRVVTEMMDGRADPNGATVMGRSTDQE